MSSESQTLYLVQELEGQNRRQKKWLICITAWLVITWLWPLAAPAPDSSTSYQPPPAHAPQEMTLQKLTITKPGSAAKIVLESTDENATLSMTNGRASTTSVVTEGVALTSVGVGERHAKMFVSDDGMAMFDVMEGRGQSRVILGVLRDAVSWLKLIGPDGKQSQEVSHESSDRRASWSTYHRDSSGIGPRD